MKAVERRTARLKTDLRRKWITRFNAAIHFLTAFIKMVDRLPWRSGEEQQEEDETNFLPLPEIRIPGTVDWAPFQGQGQTQY